MAADDVVSGDRSDDEGQHDPTAMSIGKRHHMEKMVCRGSGVSPLVRVD